MIKFLSNWIEQITISIIIVSIFDLILPNGNIKKYIKVVLGVYIIFCVISPFVGSSKIFKFDEINIDKYIGKTSTVVNQETMDLRIQKLYIEQLENDIKEKIEEKGYKLSKCNIDANFTEKDKNSGIHKIDLIVSKNNINIEKVEIGLSNTDDNKEEVENLKENIASIYEIDKDIINIRIN